VHCDVFSKSRVVCALSATAERQCGTSPTEDVLRAYLRGDDRSEVTGPLSKPKSKYSHQTL